MTKGELLAALERLPDDAQVVIRDDVNDVTVGIKTVRWEADEKTYDSQAIPAIMLIEG